jgi:hypothetical protein
MENKSPSSAEETAGGTRLVSRDCHVTAIMIVAKPPFLGAPCGTHDSDAGRRRSRRERRGREDSHKLNTRQ